MNLPNSMSKLSLTGGILVQLGCAGIAVYTLFLLVALYHEYKRAEVRGFANCCAFGMNRVGRLFPSTLSSHTHTTTHHYTTQHPQLKKGTWYQEPGRARRTRVTQYHAIITETTGHRWLGEFAR